MVTSQKIPMKKTDIESHLHSQHDSFVKESINTFINVNDSVVRVRLDMWTLTWTRGRGGGHRETSVWAFMWLLHHSEFVVSESSGSLNVSVKTLVSKSQRETVTSLLTGVFLNIFTESNLNFYCWDCFFTGQQLKQEVLEVSRPQKITVTAVLLLLYM